MNARVCQKMMSHIYTRTNSTSSGPNCQRLVRRGLMEMSCANMHKALRQSLAVSCAGSRFKKPQTHLLSPHARMQASANHFTSRNGCMARVHCVQPRSTGAAQHAHAQPDTAQHSRAHTSARGKGDTWPPARFCPIRRTRTCGYPNTQGNAQQSAQGLKVFVRIIAKSVNQEYRLVVSHVCSGHGNYARVPPSVSVG